MKKLILSAFIAFTSCLGGTYAQTATISPVRLQPKWTLRLPSQITLSDGTTASYVYGSTGWSSLVDSKGNAAYGVQSDTLSNVILWISSKGVFLAAIPVLRTTILSVSEKALYMKDDGSSGWCKYSLVKGRVIKTLPQDGDYVPMYAAPNYGLIGVTETDATAHLISLSCFPY
jgi:hypothetical protein